jgi:cytochrome c oxidase subunit I+III
MSASVDQTPPGSPALRLHRQLAAIWATGPGWQRLAAVNHTVIGLRFIITAFAFFAIGGVLGMLTRVQLATPLSTFMTPETYNQVFTVHGSMMLFLFAIPMIEGVAVYLAPKVLGARDFAFPRLTAYGYWCYLFGGTIVAVSLLAGVAPDSGWFMYTPLSSNVYTPGINADVWLLGITFVEISALTLAVEIVVSILKMRAPGMSLDRMPIFGWYMLVTALMMVAAFPPLILGSILLETERAFGLPFFDPTRGGDPLLWQHLFWLFGHPDVYIIFLPMAGVLSTIIPALAGRPLVGYRAIVVAIIALAFVSFGIWVHHMFTVGIPHLALAFFSAASAIVAVPTAVQIFAWLATLAAGRPRWNVPMLYVFGFFFVFVIGGLTGVMLAMVPFDWQAHDSYFVVAHMHYVVAGALAFPMLAALYYWLPLLTGRTAIHGLSVPAFWLIFVGFNLTFFLMHLTGLRGMPRRIYTYADGMGWNTLNMITSAGSLLFAIGVLLFFWNVLVSRKHGRIAGDNPWDAPTLEWATTSPPPPYNFVVIPTVGSRHPLWEGRLGETRSDSHVEAGLVLDKGRENVATTPLDAQPDAILKMPGDSLSPFVLSLCLTAIFVGLLLNLWVLVGLAVAASAAAILGWLWPESKLGETRAGVHV